MKKILAMLLALTMVLSLAACADTNPNGSEPAGSTPPATNPPATNPPATNPPATNPPATNPPATNPPATEPGVDPTADLECGDGPTDLDFNADPVNMEGEWKLSQVYLGDTAHAAVPDSVFFKMTKELDPSELVDGPAYIHNPVWNFTGRITFGLKSITDVLTADDIDEFKGSTSWEDFPRGYVMPEGQPYFQNGPATMRFKDVDDYGLFLKEIAGIEDEIDTTEKVLIIGLNKAGQLLIGFSDEHLERYGTEGEWSYVLVFDKA